MPAAWSWYLGSQVLGCCTLCLQSRSSAGLRMQPYPRSPGHVWPGHLHGTGCLSARAMDTGFPTVMRRLCVRLGLAVAPPILAGVYDGCVWVRVFASRRQSWLGSVVCVFGHGFWPFDAGLCRVGLSFGFTPPILAGVMGCLCLCTPSPCTPPVLAGVCVVGVCAWVRASAAPRRSWLGCWGVCICVRARPLSRQS